MICVIGELVRRATWHLLIYSIMCSLIGSVLSDTTNARIHAVGVLSEDLFCWLHIFCLSSGQGHFVAAQGTVSTNEALRAA